MFEQDLGCQEPLGMESIAITDRQISASSIWGAASQGRLHSQTGGGGWIAAQSDVNQWLQVDLGNQHTKVTRVATQRRHPSSLWVTKYKLQYSNDGVNFQYYKEQNTDKVKLVHVCIKLLLHTNTLLIIGCSWWRGTSRSIK